MPRPLESPQPNPWLAWLQLGLSTMLAVLFLVILARSRDQNLELRQLKIRIATLESSRTLEKAADQNSQLRILTQRLQDLETQVGERIERSENERMRVQQLLSDLRGRMPAAASAPQEDATDPAMPRPRETSAGILAPVLRPAPPTRTTTGQ